MGPRRRRAAASDAALYSVLHLLQVVACTKRSQRAMRSISRLLLASRCFHNAIYNLFVTLQLGLRCQGKLERRARTPRSRSLLVDRSLYKARRGRDFLAGFALTGLCSSRTLAVPAFLAYRSLVGFEAAALLLPAQPFGTKSSPEALPTRLQTLSVRSRRGKRKA